MYTLAPDVIASTHGVRSNLFASEIATPFRLAMTEKIAQFRFKIRQWSAAREAAF